jgi:hypothetical protein
VVEFDGRKMCIYEYSFMKSKHSCLKQITELDNCNKRISHTENDCGLL